MQVVYTPGKTAPLPAEIRLLNDPSPDREEFFYMSDNVDFEDLRRIGPPETGGRVVPHKTTLRTFLQECIVKCWTNMELQDLPGNTYKSFAWPSPTEAMKAEFMNVVRTVKSEPDYKDIRDRLDMYGLDFLAEQIVNLAETVRVHKNWSSQAAGVGAAICNFAILLANTLLVPEVSDLEHFKITRPVASILTGGCYGSRHNVFIEYMASQKVLYPDGTEAMYLEEEVFKSEGHGELIKGLFDTKKEGFQVPRPTKASTADWTVTYFGCPMLYGEGKTSVGAEGAEKACLCASQQMAFRDSSLVMHSSNDKFRVYKSSKNRTTKRFDTFLRKTQTYELSNVPAKTRKLDCIPEFAGLPDRCSDDWERKIHVQMRGFLRAAFECMDILADPILTSFRQLGNKEGFLSM